MQTKLSEDSLTTYASTVNLQFEKANSAAEERSIEIDETITAHTFAVDAQLVAGSAAHTFAVEAQLAGDGTSATAERATEIEKMLLTKLEVDSLMPIHVELAKLRADRETLEQVKAELAMVNQTIDMQVEKLNSAVADRAADIDEML